MFVTDKMFGDFEDLETGEVHQGEDNSEDSGGDSGEDNTKAEGEQTGPGYAF